MKRVSVVGVAAVAVVAVLSIGAGVSGLAGEGSTDRPRAHTATPEASATRVLGPGTVNVVMRVEHSRFVPSLVRVRPGTDVRFVVVNDDPINHELIVGPRLVHDLHQAGTHGTHPAVPGEVSVLAGDVGITTYPFDEPDRVLFACHLPGHFTYGMVGEVRVERS